MLIFILIDAQYSQKAFFSFEEGSHHQNHSSSGKNITPPQHLIKISPKLNFQYLPLGGGFSLHLWPLFEEPCVAGKVFIILSISLLYPKESFVSNFKKARKKKFLMEQLPIDSYMLLCKQKNYIPIHPHTLSFSFDIFRLFT